MANKIEAKVESFLKDITEVCKKHNMTIEHEDGHGSFIIETLNASLGNWPCEAIIGDTLK